MGTLLDSYLKLRDLRNFARTQEWTIDAQLNAIDAQMNLIISRRACIRSELARSAYFHGYVIGILDSITSIYERETRKRFGLELYHEIFVKYLKERFLVGRNESEILFRSACDQCRADDDAPGLRDGYADGLLSLRRTCPSRLLEHFAAREAPVSDGMEFAAVLAM